MTINEVIQLLPFDKKFKEELAKKYPLMEPDVRFQFEQLVWDLYSAVMETESRLKLQEMVFESKDKLLDKDAAYAQACQTVLNQLKEGVYSEQMTDELTQVRSKLQSLIQNSQTQNVGN